MGSKFMKSLMVAVFSLFLGVFSQNTYAQETHEEHKNAEEKFAMIQSLQQIREFLLELKASL